jgi:hypothetical protein
LGNSFAFLGTVQPFPRVEDREVGTFLKPVMGIVSVVDLNFLWTTGGDLNKSELTAVVFFTVAVKTEGFPKNKFSFLILFIFTCHLRSRRKRRWWKRRWH